MSATKSILTEAASFSSKLLYHEERSKSSPNNFPIFANPLYFNIESGNDILTFKESASKPEILDFVKGMRK